MKPVRVEPVAVGSIAEMRDAFRDEMGCQIVHDAIHHRRGWTVEHALVEGDRTVGYASLAVDGPWRGRPTFYEMYVVPERRFRAFALFEAFLAATTPPAFEVQSSDVMSTTLALTFARDIATERVVFRDGVTTSLTIPGAVLVPMTPPDDVRTAIEERQGGGEWTLEIDGTAVGRGGMLFHYNRPYGDVYMDVGEEFRGRGYGAFIVQEMKRICYELGAIPAARCRPTNTASARTLQRAGMFPHAHILFGSFRSAVDEEP